MNVVRRRTLVAAALTAALFSSTSCSSETEVAVADAAEATTTAAPPVTAAATAAPEPFEPSLRAVPCADPPDRATECHEFTVAADRSAADGRTVTLPVLVLAAREQPAAGAVVIPGGGPGFAAVPDAAYWAGHALRERYDLVLYDQRGTGGATPSLECPERDDEVIAAFGSAEPPPNDLYAVSEASLVCRARLEAGGVVFDDYDTAASAADLDELRAALGHERWTVLGISYGSRLALEVMRSYPEGLASVVLDSVYDVTSGGITATIASAERAIGVLVAANPGLDATLEELRVRFNATPWEGEVDLGRGEGPQRFVITGDDLLGGVFTALYDRSLVPLLPGIIAAIAAGDTSVVPTMLVDGVAFSTGAADAMQLSVDCADNAGLGLAATDDETAVTEERFTTLAALRGPSCLDWDVEPTSPEFNEPVVSDVPALVLAGGYDPITPPEGSRAVADRLPNARFVLFPEFAHGVTGNDPCATSIQLAFLADAGAPLDTSCAGG